MSKQPPPVSAYGGVAEAERLAAVHKPLAATSPAPLGTYRCGVCNILWLIGPDLNFHCTVLHSPNECCHFGQRAWGANS